MTHKMYGLACNPVALDGAVRTNDTLGSHDTEWASPVNMVRRSIFVRCRTCCKNIAYGEMYIHFRCRRLSHALFRDHF